MFSDATPMSQSDATTERRQAPRGSGGLSLAVPIRSLGENHRARVEAHLLALSPEDRYYRFGFAANDAQIRSYVQLLDFDRDEVFGIYNRNLQLLAVAHLAYARAAALQDCAEFGVSVAQQARGRGYGKRLFERAVMHARNHGVRVMVMQVLSENTVMLKIARHAGAVVHRDGAESEAVLELLPATLETHLEEMVGEQLALANYRVKRQAQQFRAVLRHWHRLWADPPAGS